MYITTKITFVISKTILNNCGNYQAFNGVWLLTKNEQEKSECTLAVITRRKVKYCTWWQSHYHYMLSLEDPNAVN